MLLQLRREFRAVAGLHGHTSTLLSEWLCWEEKIISFSRIEATSRKTIREIVNEYDKEVDMPFPAGEIYLLDYLKEFL